MRGLVAPEFSWLLEGLMVCLLLGLLLSLVTGVLLLWRPKVLFALNERLSRWVDTDEPFRALEKPRHWERFFYRHHRLLGGFIVAGAAYVLVVWAFVYERSHALGLLDRRWRVSGLDWTVAATETIVVLLHVFVLAVGVVVFVRPSLLKNVERAANRWQSGPAVDALNRIVRPLDRPFQVYPRLSGLVLLIASLWSLAALTPFVRQLLGG